MGKNILKKTCVGLLFTGIIVNAWVNDSWATEKTVESKGQDKISLSLEDISRIGLENNLDIQIAKYDAYIKRTGLEDSQSVFDIFLNGQAFYLNDQQNSDSSLAGTKNISNNYSLGLSKTIPTGTKLGVEVADARSASNSTFSSINPNHEANVKFTLNQPLGSNFFGMLDRGQIKLSRLDIDNSDFSVLERIEKSLADLQKTYWQLALRLEELNIARQMLERSKKLYEVFARRNKLGLVEDAELFALEANLIQNNIDITIAQQQLRIAQNALLLALNEEDFSLDIMPKSELTGLIERLTAKDILRTAVNQRRDYKQAKNDLEIQNINLTMKQNSLWPRIDLDASFARNGLEADQADAWQNVGEQDNPELYVGLSFSMPLENRSARSKKQKAENEKAKALLNLKRIEYKIIVQIKNAVDAVNMYTDKIKAQQQILDLQEKKLAYEEKRFSNGRSDSDTLVRFQQDLLAAQRNLAQSLFAYKAARIDLKQAANSLLDAYWTGKL
ncbi:MAG: TolC family protein [Candidatus Omnitrophica bacterium]|nr:TolC family protein [Candidatus Omnitrophota bacterium]